MVFFQSVFTCYWIRQFHPALFVSTLGFPALILIFAAGTHLIPQFVFSTAFHNHIWTPSAFELEFKKFLYHEKNLMEFMFIHFVIFSFNLYDFLNCIQVIDFWNRFYLGFSFCTLITNFFYLLVIQRSSDFLIVFVQYF
jgi:hypothetical protein